MPASFPPVTREEQQVYALAQTDRACHLAHGVSLNPFSTQGARAEWYAGYLGKRFPLLPEPLTEPATGSEGWRIYTRGQYARMIEQQEAQA